MHTSVKNATIFQNVSAHAIDVRALSVLMRIIFFCVIYVIVHLYTYTVYSFCSNILLGIFVAFHGNIYCVLGSH